MLSGFFASLRAMPRTVWLIGLISLINDSASEMLYPLIPLYLASVLMAGPKALGIIEGIAEATASLLKLFSGVLMDRSRRAKPWMLWGYGLAGFSRPLIAFVNSWHGLLLIRFADRVGKGLRSSPRDALLAASVSSKHRGLAFGLHRAMDNAGAVVGPLLAAVLLATGMPLQDVFLWSIVPAVICVALTLMIREEAPVELAATRSFDWRLNDMPPALKRYLVVIALFSLGNSSNMFLLLRAHELGVQQTLIPVLWAAVSAVAMIFGAPLSGLSDHIGRTRLLVCGYVAYAIIYFSLGSLLHASFWLFALFALYGIFLAATEGVEKAMVADLAPAGRQGTAFGWFNLIAGLMLLPASVLFGWIYQGIAPWAAFTFSAACVLLAAVLLAGWVRADLPDASGGTNTGT